MGGVPRRSYIDQRTAAEAKISEAIAVVEALGADVRLTDAVSLLSAARDSVGDVHDGLKVVRRFVRTEPFTP